MNKLKFTLVLLVFAFTTNAQQPGDTIRISAFKYGSTTRDTLIQFPTGNLTYDRIIMKYNMRCKNNLISNNTFPNQGCGEWDYSCNTFIVDSTRIETELNQAPSHIISNFSGNTFSYTAQQVYDFYTFTQTSVTLNNIVSENQYTLSAGNSTIGGVLKTNERSGRSQLLFTAAELNSAGLTAGNIDGFFLQVTNAGGGANFLKVEMKHSTASNLASSVLNTSGFTNVYNHHYAFTNGANRIQFHTPFVWNGTDNVLVDISFTNTNPSLPVVLSGAVTTSVMTLHANNNYAIDLAALGHVAINPAQMGQISNEITVSFWVYGNSSFLPANTSVIHANNGNNNRSLNVHLPWSNGRVYFDCGFANGGYDRIDKVASTAEQHGQWNYWAFTKNASTGDMKIYLNGSLWHSGTALTKSISIVSMVLGKDNSLQNNFKGRLSELTIWNKELQAADILSWMNKPVDNTHPFYSNLIAYYKMNEGSGQVVNDSKNSLSSNGTNLQWTYERGNKLNRGFTESNLRPTVVFLRGTYAMGTVTVTAKDSVLRNPRVVQQYSITPGASVTPMAHDIVTLVSTYTLQQASPSNIYNGDTGALTGTIAVATQSVINISNLPYNRRFPYYNEILSFVTPYGKGLDLGPKGKTWYFDLSDFEPLLKGPKRLLMTMGGENQEQMDIDFYFIVGTPPRNVVQFNQLWQGPARLGGVSIASINNDSRLSVQNVTLPSAAQFFKLRSTITGHGSHGEFGQNGGIVSHYFNINGGPNEFTWQITQECSKNPVFPQGGTWVYDRQGWCPGEFSLLKELDLTPYVTPGSTVTMDYNCSNPQVSGGDYRYLVANQLVSYGAANRSLDAAMVDVLAPTDKVLYSRSNPVCSNPVVRIRNTGSTAISSVVIDYWINNTAVKQTYTYTGNLAFLDTATIVLPINSLWGHGINATGNVFHAEIKDINAGADTYTVNNYYHSPFVMTDIVPASFVVEFKTNNNPLDNTYRIEDESGNIISGTSMLTSPNTVYSDSYEMEGCFTIIVEDKGGDGLQWWANTAQGNGYVRLKNSNNVVLKTFQPDFGGYFEYSFTTFNPLGLKNAGFNNNLRVYPNPAREKFSVIGTELEGCEIKIYNVLGNQVSLHHSQVKNGLEFSTTSLTPGVYFVVVSKGNDKAVKKVVVE